MTDTLAEYDFYEIASVDDLPNGERIFLEIGDQPVVVFNIAGGIFILMIHSLQPLHSLQTYGPMAASSLPSPPLYLPAATDMHQPVFAAT